MGLKEGPVLTKVVDYFLGYVAEDVVVGDVHSAIVVGLYW